MRQYLRYRIAEVLTGWVNRSSKKLPFDDLSEITRKAYLEQADAVIKEVNRCYREHSVTKTIMANSDNFVIQAQFLQIKDIMIINYDNITDIDNVEIISSLYEEYGKRGWYVEKVNNTVRVTNTYEG